ncbi:MAG: SurA N-terminal domain-containing protein [Gammaproteobacteria bacterium]|nr:SurA N-terminal domain-containing protein [Gammaproteobacteria bacterium]
MLQIIRDRAQGVFAWIIVGLITIPFALWGINSYFGGGGDDGVAEVDGVKISPREVQSAYQQQRDRLQQMFGGKIPENLFSEEMMKAQVLQQLIEKEVLIQAAVENGLRIGDGQLANIITSIDAFAVDGRFDAEQYERVLARQGMSPRLFEQRVRRDLMASQLTDAIVNSEFTLPSEVDAHLRLQQQHRDIGYMVLPVSRFEDEVTVAAEELRAYYEENSRRYMEPEQVKIDYLELKTDDIATAMEVSDEELRLRYEAQKLNFRTPEERQARHLLIQADSSASVEERAAARLKAEELLQRLNSGEDFATLAQAESQDPGSARKGGDLGFFGKGVMDPAFEQAAFALKKGALSGVVESAFGFHIIKVEAIKGGESKPYEQVVVELKREIQQERAAEIYFDKAEQLANFTYEQPDTLSVAAEQLALEIKSSDYFSRSGGAGISSDGKIVTAAFSEDVLARGNNSAPIELGNDHLVVLRIKQHQPEALRPFEAVSAQIEATLKREKAMARAQETATNLLAKLQAGETPESLAASWQLEWQRQSGLQRDNKVVTSAIVQTAFRMPHPAEGTSHSELLTLASGDQALVAIYAVHSGDSSAVTANIRSDAAQRLERAANNGAEQALIAALRQRAEITIKQ